MPFGPLWRPAGDEVRRSFRVVRQKVNKAPPPFRSVGALHKAKYKKEAALASGFCEVD